MSKRTYVPRRGDLIMINFQPAVGREIDKRRPAVVITPDEYNRLSGCCVAVPVTSVVTPGPMWLELPPGHLPKPSLVLCDYVKSFDWRERSAEFVASLPEQFVREVVGKFLDLIDPQV